MLIGAHVSSTGGLLKAWERGLDLGCDAIQVFNQSPRMWRPARHREEDLAELRERVANGPIRSLVIHAVYLLNLASTDAEIRDKSLTSLVHALGTGDAAGADGVVLHPGSQKGEPLEPSLERVGEGLRHALGETERCRLLLENTAGAGGTLGRSFAWRASSSWAAGTAGSGSASTAATCSRAGSTSAPPRASPRSWTTSSASST
jgi:deoxyribonuclease-4